MKKFKIKVCGMTLAANIASVASLQPDYLGFIFYSLSPRSISDVSAELIKYIPEEIRTVGVFVDEDVEEVKKKVKLHHLKAIQLHGSETVAYCKELKNSLNDIEIIKAFGVNEDFNFAALDDYQDSVDFFLFDTKTKTHGGSGKTFDWKLLNRYQLDKPYFLSGGIDLQHTIDINQIDDSRLYALDINSRFELEPGVKDAEKIKDFIKKIDS